MRQRETPPSAPRPGAKAAARRRLLAARGALGAEWRAAASAAVCARLLAAPQLQRAGTVAGYAPFGSEVDAVPLLGALLRAGRRVALPWVDGDALQLAAVTDLDADLAPGWRGVREPRPALRRALAFDLVDAVVAPAVGVDRAGNRLGYGGGHYDRLLAALRPDATVFVVAFEAQLLPCLPVEPHDRRADVVVTEERLLLASAAR